MAEHMLASALEWLEHKSKPIFVIAALIAYGVEIYVRSTSAYAPENLNEFLIMALGALVTPFSIILLQEILELVAKISESNLLSARHQFEIVILVIVRSFFKSFSKVNEYVQDGVFSDTVQEAVVKVFAIIILMVLISLFRFMSDSDYLYWYSEQGKRSNLYKQVLVVILVIAAIFYQIFAPRQEEAYSSGDAAQIAELQQNSEAATEADKAESHTETSDSHVDGGDDEQHAGEQNVDDHAGELKADADAAGKAKEEDKGDFLSKYFDVFGFVSLVFTGLIVIEALFLIISIMKGDFPQLMLESGLIIALIFARFPLFVSNTLSYSLSVLGVAFGTAALYLYYRISKWAQETGLYPRRHEAQQE